MRSSILALAWACIAVLSFTPTHQSPTTTLQPEQQPDVGSKYSSSSSSSDIYQYFHQVASAVPVLLKVSFPHKAHTLSTLIAVGGMTGEDVIQGWGGEDTVVAVMDKETLQRVERAGLHGTILSHDIGVEAALRNEAELAARKRRVLQKNADDGDVLTQGSMGGFLTLKEVRQYTIELNRAHPDIISKPMAIGCTLLNATMYAIRVSALPSCAHPGVDGCPPDLPLAFPDDDVNVGSVCPFNDIKWPYSGSGPTLRRESAESTPSAMAPRFLLTALHHAREPAGLSNILYYLRSLAQDYASGTPAAVHLLKTREIWVVPVVNPDGYHFNNFMYETRKTFSNHRKNMRPAPSKTVCEETMYTSIGVDINRNYGFEWGRDNQGSSPDFCDDAYRGSAAFSEPETRVMRDFVGSLGPTLILNYHTFGGFIIYPFGYAPVGKKKDIRPVDQTLFEEYSLAIKGDTAYKPGTADSLLYSVNGEASDYFYGEQDIPTFTIEAGKDIDDFYPPVSRILEIARENEPMISYLAWAIDARYSHVGQNYSYSDNDTLSITVHLRNDGMSNAHSQVTVTWTPKAPWGGYIDWSATLARTRVAGTSEDTRVQVAQQGVVVVNEGALMFTLPASALPRRSPVIELVVDVQFTLSQHPYTDKDILRVLDVHWSLNIHDNVHIAHPFVSTRRDTFLPSACGGTCIKAADSHVRCDYAAGQCRCQHGWEGPLCNRPMENSSNVPPPPFNVLNLILYIAAVSVALLAVLYTVRYLVRRRKSTGHQPLPELEMREARTV